MKTNILNNINTIPELRPYACAKAIRAKEWSLTCVDCAKKDGCACGSRVVELLDNQTKSVKTDQPKKKVQYSAARPSTVARIRACFAPDVHDHIQWVLDNTKVSNRKDACTTILNWIKGNPELNEELHMKERYDACKLDNPIGKKKASQSKRPLSETKEWDKSGFEEVSVEEFLKENAEPTASWELDTAKTTGKALTEPATDEPMLIHDPEKDEIRIEADNEKHQKLLDGLLVDSFNSKRQELVLELKNVISEMNVIRRKIAALDEAAKIFGMEMGPLE